MGLAYSRIAEISKHLSYFPINQPVNFYNNKIAMFLCSILSNPLLGGPLSRLIGSPFFDFFKTGILK